MNGEIFRGKDVALSRVRNFKLLRRTARTMSSRPPRLNAVAYISAAQSPILVRTFVPNKQDDLKYHYIAHTSLDVIEERGPPICRNSIDFWS